MTENMGLWNQFMLVMCFILMIIALVIDKAKGKAAKQHLLYLNKQLKMELVRPRFPWQRSILVGMLGGFPVRVSYKLYGRGVAIEQRRTGLELVFRLVLPHKFMKIRLRKRDSVNLAKSRIKLKYPPVDDNYVIKTHNPRTAKKFLGQPNIRQALEDFVPYFGTDEVIIGWNNHVFFHMPARTFTDEHIERFERAMALLLLLAEEFKKK